MTNADQEKRAREVLATGRWRGDSAVLPIGAVVEVLAVDRAGRGDEVPARTACWVRHRRGDEWLRYRSCDLADLELSDADFDWLTLADQSRPSPQVGRCETCAHWRFDKPDWQFDDLRIGECKAVRMRETIEEEAVEGSPYDRHDEEAEPLIKAAFQRAKAIAIDGSGYYAALRTFADFGCVLHLATPATEEQSA